MSVTKIATRYAQSLLDLAIESDQVEKVREDVNTFLSACDENNDLELLLKSPIVNESQKKKIILEVFEDAFTKLMLEFTKLVIHKGREPYLQDIANSYIELYNEYNNILPATLTTAVPIKDKTKDQIKKLVEKTYDKKVNLTTRVDDEIIGGFVLKFDDYLYDASLDHQLQEIERKLTTSTE